METGFCHLRQKEVVNVKDGRRLGRVNDVIFTFPEGKTLGVVVPGGRGFFQPGMFIDLRNIVKIGEDVVLVEVNCPPKSKPPKRGRPYTGREEFCDPRECEPHDCEPPKKPRPFEDEE